MRPAVGNSPLGGEILVNTATASHQNDPDIQLRALASEAYRRDMMQKRMTGLAPMRGKLVKPEPVEKPK